MYQLSFPLHVRTTTEGFADGLGFTSDGWKLAEDVPGKPGLIAEAVGARAVFRVPANLVELHVHAGVLHVFHLNSYQHTGVMVVNVSRLPSSGGLCLQNASVLASRVIDCLWDTPTSVSVFDELAFGGTGGWKPQGACLDLEVALEVVAAVPPRPNNKVKLFSLALF